MSRVSASEGPQAKSLIALDCFGSEGENREIFAPWLPLPKLFFQVWGSRLMGHADAKAWLVPKSIPAKTQGSVIKCGNGSLTGAPGDGAFALQVAAVNLVTADDIQPLHVRACDTKFERTRILRLADDCIHPTGLIAYLNTQFYGDVKD